MTKVCFSLAGNPGTTGTIIHSALAKKYNVDYSYRALSLRKGTGFEDFCSAFYGLRALNVRACSFSMPFKKYACNIATARDPIARATGVANSVVFSEYGECAYNIDAIAAHRVLEFAYCKWRKPKTHPVLILGCGSTARSYVYALKEMGINDIFIAHWKNSVDLSLSTGIVDWRDIDSFTKQAGLLINTTPASAKIHECFDSLSIKCRMDIIDVNQNTHLCTLGEKSLDGKLMAAWNSVLQFSLYASHSFTNPEHDAMYALNLIS